MTAGSMNMEAMDDQQREMSIVVGYEGPVQWLNKQAKYTDHLKRCIREDQRSPLKKPSPSPSEEAPNTWKSYWTRSLETIRSTEIARRRNHSCFRARIGKPEVGAERTYTLGQFRSARVRSRDSGGTPTSAVSRAEGGLDSKYEPSNGRVGQKPDSEYIVTLAGGGCQLQIPTASTIPCVGSQKFA
ncbi:hypothetical protein OE88DRAFT_1644364 [Heliocybe sulcata]|uniref:Uncharacterized protein n=1 Tax=Heliocybe sulcata TaxID=5364 RepID=A0A5C3N3X9_9AGAM|nr:hypothetical protein OE88DRAFT_1644364 [Heliocybe sulcata]